MADQSEWLNSFLATSYTPGNYKFGDFLRVGVPFSIVVLIVSVIMVPLLLPL